MTQQRNENATVTLGGKEVPLMPLTARRGLTAATLLLPHLAAFRPVISRVVELRDNPGEQAERRLGVELLMDGLGFMGPLLKPETFLAIAEAVTGISAQELGDAALDEVLVATARGLTRINMMAVLGAGVDVFTQFASLTQELPAEAPAE